MPKAKKPTHPLHKIIKNHVGDDCACYVLITCKKPSSKGDMIAELSYQGDDCLASYLIDYAQGLFEESSSAERQTL